MGDGLFWIVGFISFTPLHLGLPLLVRLINHGHLPEAYLRWLAFELFAASVVFALAYGLSQLSLLWAMLLIAILIPLPWVTIRKLN